MAFDGNHAVPIGFFQVFDAFLEVVGVHAAADRRLAGRDARLLATNGGRWALTRRGMRRLKQWMRGKRSAQYERRSSAKRLQDRDSDDRNPKSEPAVKETRRISHVFDTGGSILLQYGPY